MPEEPSTPLHAPSLAIVDRADDPARWDRFVSESEDATFCHLAGWRKVMSEVLGHESLYWAALDSEGNWQGTMPLVRVRSRLFGDYLVSMPFLNYGGPIGTPTAQRALVEHAASTARRLRVDLLELRSRHAVQCDLRRSDRKITVVMELPDAADTLWTEGFTPKLRSQIRRPMKERMEARFGSNQISAFYDVFAAHMRALGTPVLPEALFTELARVFGDHVVYGVIYRGNEPVASGCGFQWRQEFEMTWASALGQHKREAPNMLLYWSFMEEMIQRKIRTFNFGRCTPGSGTHRFKRQWGGHDVQLPWIQSSLRDVTATPSPDRAVYRLAASAWSRLPRVVTDRLGPVLARKIP